MKLDPLLNAAVWTSGDVAKAAGMPEVAVRGLVRRRILRPKSGGGGSGNFYTFTVVDAIAAAVWATFNESNLGSQWCDRAARFISHMSAEEITAACNEGQVGIVPVNEALTKWVLEPIPTDLPSAQRSLCERLSLKAALERTQRGIKRMLETRSAGRHGRLTGVEQALSE
jgi:hypothetical protein